MFGGVFLLVFVIHHKPQICCLYLDATQNGLILLRHPLTTRLVIVFVLKYCNGSIYCCGLAEILLKPCVIGYSSFQVAGKEDDQGSNWASCVVV